MFAQIARALTKGYTTKQIVDMLLRRFPNQSGKIKDALAAGYTVDQIVQYLGGGKEAVSNLENMPESGVNTEFARTAQADIDRERKANQLAMAAGGLAVGGLGAGMAARAYQHALPTNLLGYGPGTPPIQPPNQPTSPIPMGPGPNSPGVQVLPTNQSPSPIPTGPKTPPMQTAQQGFPQTQAINPQPSQPPSSQASTILQPPITPQVINPQRDIKKSVDILKNLGEDGRVKNLLSGGMTPKDIAGVLKTIMPKDKFKALESQEGGVEALIEDLATSMQSTPEVAPEGLPEVPNAEAMQKQPQERAEMEPASPQLDEVQQEIETPKEKKPVAKNDVVSSPHGVGEVLEARNGKAIVEVDGKKHQVDEDELIQSPLSSDELADLHDNLLRGIEQHTGEEISRNVEWAGYDPKLNELAYKPWMGGGKIYTYGDISPSDVAELQDIMAERKTSGGNFVGAWEKNTKSPIGNRMHALISRLQKERGGKGNEYRNKFESVYDPTEIAKKASQERYKNERKAQKTGQQQPRNSPPASHHKRNETKEKEEPKEKLIKEYEEDGDKVYSAQIPTSEIVARPKLMQFKAISEEETGENPLDTLKGKFDTLKSGVLLLWQPKDPSKYDMSGNQKFIVANGHHRLAFAKRENHPKMLTRIIKESDGYDATDAMRIGAEINIAEGRGTVYDQAKYFRNLISTRGKNEASLGAGKTGRPGERAWTIAANAKDELFQTFINEDIKPEQAEAIALATDNKDRQALGLKFARDGKSADQIKNLLEASKLIKTKPDEQMSLFGFDDSAFKAMEKMGEAATKIQRDINQSLASITGASRNPNKAKKFGVDVKDPEAVKEARNRLNKEKDLWKNWSSHYDLVDQVKKYIKDHE